MGKEAFRLISKEARACVPSPDRTLCFDPTELQLELLPAQGQSLPARASRCGHWRVLCPQTILPLAPLSQEVLDLSLL